MYQVQRIDNEGRIYGSRYDFNGLEEAHKMADKLLEVWLGARIKFNGKPILEVFASPSWAWAVAQDRACRMMEKGETAQ